MLKNKYFLLAEIKGVLMGGTLSYRHICCFVCLPGSIVEILQDLQEDQNFCSTCKCHPSENHSQTTLIDQWITLLYAITFVNNKCFCYLIRLFFLKYWYKLIWILFLSCSLFYYCCVTLFISVPPLIIQCCKIRFILWVITELNLPVSQILNNCSGWNLWEYCHRRAIQTLSGFLMDVQWLQQFKRGRKFGTKLNSVNVLL